MLRGQPSRSLRARLPAGREAPVSSRRAPRAASTYPWQRERYWIAPASPRRTAGTATGHPLLGVRVPVASVDAFYEIVLVRNWSPPGLTDHRVGGQHPRPRGRACAGSCARPRKINPAARRRWSRASCCKPPLVVPGSGGRLAQVVLTEGGVHASIYSLASDAPARHRVDRSTQRRRSVQRPPLHPPRSISPRSGADAPTGWTSLRRTRGLPHWGELRTDVPGGSGTVVGARRSPCRKSPSCPGWKSKGTALTLSLLDAALQVVLGALGAQMGGALLPFELGRFAVHLPAASSAWVRRAARRSDRRWRRRRSVAGGRSGRGHRREVEAVASSSRGSASTSPTRYGSRSGPLSTGSNGR